MFRGAQVAFPDFSELLFMNKTKRLWSSYQQCSISNLKMHGSVEDKIQSIRSESIDKRKSPEQSFLDSEVNVIKEGNMDKESSSKIFQWRSKYCVLSSEHLTIYRWHSKKSAKGTGNHERVKNILYRFPLDDVTSMSNIVKRKRHVFFTICTKEGSLDLRVPTEDRDWITQIQMAVLERKNRLAFVRELKSRTNLFASKKRRNNVRRRSFKKDAKYGDGIGITIKNEGDNVLVARVFSEGPAARKGTIQVGDEIISVDGVDVCGRHAEDVAVLIKSRPSLVVLTVKPADKNQAMNCQVSVGMQGETRHPVRVLRGEQPRLSTRQYGDDHLHDDDNDIENKDPKSDNRLNTFTTDTLDIHPIPSRLTVSTTDVTCDKVASKQTHSTELECV